MFINPQRGAPLYDQLYKRLRRSILTGELRAGTRLPATRALAKDAGVSRNTVILAYEQLVAEGYIEGQTGSGTYVSAEIPNTRFVLEASAAPHPRSRTLPPRLSRYAKRTLKGVPLILASQATKHRFNFRYGLSSARDFPYDVWRKIYVRKLRRPASTGVTYAAPEGFLPLRQAIADYLRRARAVSCTADQIIIVNGSQQGLDLSAKILLNAGDKVLMENPHYPSARLAFLSVGAKLIATAVDRDGLVVTRIPRAALGARLAYVTPSHQYPTGAVMPLSRRIALLQWARKSGTYVLEDDSDSEYRYGGRPIEAVQALDRHDLVIYVGSMSKTLFAGLRVGYLVLPRPLVQSFSAAKFLADRHTPLLQQEVLADFINEGHFEKHLRRTSVRHAARRKALLSALHRNFGDSIEIEGSASGLHVLLWLKDVPPRNLGTLTDRAAEEGIGIYPISSYYLGKPPGSGILLGYAALEEKEIAQGVELFSRIVRSRNWEQ